MIEVLAAIVLLALTLRGLSSTTFSIIDTNTQARRLTAAANLAQDKLEELRALNVASLTAGSDPGPLTEAGATAGAGNIYYRSWTVTNPGPVANSAIVTVSVSWTDKAGSHSKQLQALLTDD